MNKQGLSGARRRRLYETFKFTDFDWLNLTAFTYFNFAYLKSFKTLNGHNKLMTSKTSGIKNHLSYILLHNPHTSLNPNRD